MEENTPGYVYNFMCLSNRFKNTGNERYFDLLDKDESTKIGFVWFKNILGGWRLQLNTDIGDEWKARGVIDVNKLKQFL